MPVVDFVCQFCRCLSNRFTISDFIISRKQRVTMSFGVVSTMLGPRVAKFGTRDEF